MTVKTNHVLLFICDRCGCACTDNSISQHVAWHNGLEDQAREPPTFTKERLIVR